MLLGGNPGTKSLKENLEGYWQATGQSKYLPAIDGRILVTRKKSALLNTIFNLAAVLQWTTLGASWISGLARCTGMKNADLITYKGCVIRRIGYFHK